jgi:TatD DNase family protein
MIHFIDSHAHIYLPEFDADRFQIIAGARERGVKEIFMPAIDASTHQAMMQVELEFEDCYAMMGLHPCSVGAGFEKELELIENYLQQRSFVAIGEIGLDLFWDKTFIVQQHEAFRQQVKLALAYNLPVVIHSRNAIDECIEVIKEFPGVRGVFHCFSGNIEQAMSILDMGLMLGIGGVVSFKNAGLDKVIAETGISRVILETDAPYLAPVPFRGKRNEPAYIEHIAQKIAGIIEMPVEEVGKLTTSNALKLFNKA